MELAEPRLVLAPYMKGPEAARREYSRGPRGALPCIGCAPNYNSFSEAAAAGVRMWFLEHRALCHHRFNSESPLHWRAVGVLNPSRAAPRRDLTNVLQGYGWVAPRKTSKSRSV